MRPTWAAPSEEQREEKQCQRINMHVLNSRWTPALQARDNHDYNKALELYEQGLKEWRAAPFKLASYQDIQSSQINSLMKAKARILEMMGRFEDAAQCYLSTIDERWQGPTSPNYQTMLDAGQIYVNGHLYDKAIETYRKVTEPAINGWNAQAHVQISEALLAEGKAQEAQKELTDALSNSSPAKNPQAARTLRTALEALYTNLKMETEAARIKTLLEDKHCPACGSDQDVLPIAYGLIISPPPGVHLGGCEVSNNSPRWWCNKDNIGF